VLDDIAVRGRGNQNDPGDALLPIFRGAGTRSIRIMPYRVMIPAGSGGCRSCAASFCNHRRWRGRSTRLGLHTAA